LSDILLLTVTVFSTAGVVLSIGNRRLGGVVGDVLSTTLFLTPLAVAIVVQADMARFGLGLSGTSILYSMLLGSALGILNAIFQYYFLGARLLLSRQTLRLRPNISRLRATRRVLESELLSPIGEGVLYRGFILGLLVPAFGLLSIPLSSAIFTVQLKREIAWNTHFRTTKSKLFMFYTVSSLALIVLLTGSLVGSVISQGLSNLPYSFGVVRKYRSQGKVVDYQR